MRTKRFSWNEGAAFVETALALTFLIPMIFGVIEFGIALYCTNAMELVIEEAGRYAMVNNTGATSCAGSLSTAVVTKANQVLVSYPVMSGSVSVPTCNAPTAATPTTPAVPAMMQIQGTFTPLNSANPDTHYDGKYLGAVILKATVTLAQLLRPAPVFAAATNGDWRAGEDGVKGDGKITH